jgi:hypothetical protein
MLTYAKLKRNRRKCVALTGLTPTEFNALLPPFVRAYAEQYPAEKTMSGTPRQRRAGGGRKALKGRFLMRQEVARVSVVC